MTQIKMPQLGESVVEGTITRWLKKEGEHVDEDELLVEVSTDKVDSEVPSSASGTLEKILVEEGATVTVGTPIAVIGEAAGEKAASPPDIRPRGEDKEAAGDAAEALVAHPDKDEVAAAQIQRSKEESYAGASQAQAEPPPEARPTPSSGADPVEAPVRAARGSNLGDLQPADDTSKRGVISPLVRRLADEHGVNLGEVAGSGTGGRIRKQDVLQHVETRKLPERAASAQPAEEATAMAQRPEEPTITGREELVPWTNIRRRTAEHMVASVQETARAWNAVEADWSDVVKLREAAKDVFRQREGFNLTYMPFLAKAVCDTLLEMPVVNATFDEANEANRIKHYVNLGVAVALEGGGLIVPVVRDADAKNLTGLARGIADVAVRARSKKLSPDDLTGGTFTITNPGPFGSMLSVPIIPRGQAAILGFEAIEKRVVVTDEDAIAIRSKGFLSLSWDHRVIDGAEAARFLSRLRERIQTMDFSSDLAQYL